jgi:6-pyruvoyltetrahydropterin/6-carboxytetrahydropterin synthase
MLDPTMSEQYCVKIEKDELVFSAGHFITFDGGNCERLHGHNYRVRVEAHGPLDENQYVIDFIALRDTLREIISELDHHMLLPTQHPMIKVVSDDREVTVTFEDRRWVFPLCDCVLLPIANTTTELLARHIGKRLIDDLRARTGTCPQRVRVEVDENYGQWGACEIEPD